MVFPGDSPDGTLTEGQWNRWTQGTFRAAKLAVGLPKARAYDLRHSFVSLLIHEGQSILEVARQAGHSPQTCLRDYGHLFDDFDPLETGTGGGRDQRRTRKLVPFGRREPAQSHS